MGKIKIDFGGQKKTHASDKMLYKTGNQFALCCNSMHDRAYNPYSG